jgi:hypothetical protein
MRKDGEQSARESLTLLSGAIRWLSLLAGGVALLLYTAEIKHFPEGIQLGDAWRFASSASAWGSLSSRTGLR